LAKCRRVEVAFLEGLRVPVMQEPASFR